MELGADLVKLNAKALLDLDAKALELDANSLELDANTSESSADELDAN